MITAILFAAALATTDQTINVTKNGFRHYISNYSNGDGTSTIVSGVLGGDFQLTPKLRSTIGGRWEWDNFVQNSENTSNRDLDGNTGFARPHLGITVDMREPPAQSVGEASIKID